MCGIAGIVSLNGRPVNPDEVRAMCSALIHRGPDDDGYYFAPGVGLGMRRLSIIDLDSGRQPIRNEDGTIWTVFNGEIYNYQELRRDLEARGHAFYTATDTETIVHLYEEYGDRCVDHLRGMFAFAVWDERRRRLLITRDRLGIKPLYYAEIGGRILFASELKAILELPEVSRELNWGAVTHLFTFLTTPPAEAIVKGVRKLEPGHWLEASPECPPQIQRYWQVRFEPDRGLSERYFIERLRELLAESVQLHLVSDVPLGAFLSGGIDSSCVVAAAAPCIREALRTFSIGFVESDYNELNYARLVADRFRTAHDDLLLGPDALGSLDDLAWYMDEPFGDSSAIPTYVVSRLASESVKVVLSGDGGDELFGGYDRYVVDQRESRYGLLPGRVRRLLQMIGMAMPDGARGRNFLRHIGLDRAQRYLDAGTVFRNDELRQLFRPDAYELLSQRQLWQERLEGLRTSDAPWLTRLQHFDLNHYLPLDILTKVDRMSMAHSIEARVPLLDHKLVEFAATIPPEMNLRRGNTKWLLKSAMRGILPDRIIDRPKHGFAVPLDYWFRGEFGSCVRELLLSGTATRRGIFNVRYIEELFRRHQAGRNLDLPLWTLISFELWARLFLDRAPARESSRQVEKYPLCSPILSRS